MAAIDSRSDCPVESKVREVLHDISFFEQYELPASPPFTPPNQFEARMVQMSKMSGSPRMIQYTKGPSTPINSTLDKMFPRSPPDSPRPELKRKFSSNLNFQLGLEILTPPSTPPTSMMRDTLVRSMSANSSEISLFQPHRRPTLNRRPTIITSVSQAGSPRRTRPSASSRSSSYSYSAASTPRSSSAVARCRDYAALSTDSQYPLSLPSPSYFSANGGSGNAPPPNTPMYSLPEDSAAGLSISYNGEPMTFSGPGSEPFPAFQNEPSSLRTVSPRPLEGFTYTPQYPNLPGPEDFKSQQTGIEDLEKQRSNPTDPFADPEGTAQSVAKRPKRKTYLFICIVITVLLALIPIIIVVVVLRKHRRHLSDCNHLHAPGLVLNTGHWGHSHNTC